MQERASRLQGPLALFGKRHLSPEIPFGDERPNPVRMVVHVHDEAIHAGPHQAIGDVLQHRPPSDLEQRLRGLSPDFPKARAKPRSKDQRIHRISPPSPAIDAPPGG